MADQDKDKQGYLRSELPNDLEDDSNADVNEQLGAGDGPLSRPNNDDRDDSLPVKNSGEVATDQRTVFSFSNVSKALSNNPRRKSDPSLVPEASKKHPVANRDNQNTKEADPDDITYRVGPQSITTKRVVSANGMISYEVSHKRARSEDDEVSLQGHITGRRVSRKHDHFKVANAAANNYGVGNGGVNKTGSGSGSNGGLGSGTDAQISIFGTDDDLDEAQTKKDVDMAHNEDDAMDMDMDESPTYSQQSTGRRTFSSSYADHVGKTGYDLDEYPIDTTHTPSLSLNTSFPGTSNYGDYYGTIPASSPSTNMTLNTQMGGMGNKGSNNIPPSPLSDGAESPSDKLQGGVQQLSLATPTGVAPTPPNEVNGTWIPSALPLRTATALGGNGQWSARATSNLGHVPLGLSDGTPRPQMGYRPDCPKCVARVPGHNGMHLR